MCASGTIGILVYCADYRSSHSIEMSAEQWPDDVRLSDIEPRFICKACGKRGADVRLHFEPARMGINQLNDARSVPAINPDDRGVKICRVNPGSRAP
jgi:hypothetical protein